MPKDYLEDVSEAAKKVAPEIEKLLQGLSVSEAKRLLYRLTKKIEADTTVTAPIPC
jgi:hypothetical protein